MNQLWTTLVDVPGLMDAMGADVRVIDARAQASASLRLVDARASLADTNGGAALYAQGHLPGAVHADLNGDLSDLSLPGLGRHPMPDSDAFARLLGQWGITPQTQVVVYDAADGSMAAARLWWLLRLMGHQAVAVLDGGFAAWQAASGVVSTAAPTHAPLPAYPGRFDHDQVVTAEQVAQRLSQPGGWLIDARAAERFSGEMEPIDPVAGHVPGAINLPYAGMVRDGRLRPVAELRQLLDAALGATDPARTVLMCGSGVTACHLLLAMETAGLHGAKVFAGSWSGWISDRSRPVARG